MSSKKIGLFFGTFDPIHNGHLNIAKYIIEENLASEVWLVVTPENPLKLKNNISSFNHRLNMVKIATNELKNIKASSLEMELEKGNLSEEVFGRKIFHVSINILRGSFGLSIRCY